MKRDIISKEIQYKAIRSSGAGGQHVNKVASKIVLSFDVQRSEGLTDTEKRRLTKKLENRLNKEGVLMLACEESRSQFRNKALVKQRLFELLEENLKKPNVRKPTKPTKGSKIRKAKAKKELSEKKKLRRKPKEY